VKEANRFECLMAQLKAVFCLQRVKNDIRTHREHLPKYQESCRQRATFATE
jgi:hypothetical protein